MEDVIGSRTYAPVTEYRYAPEDIPMAAEETVEYHAVRMMRAADTVEEVNAVFEDADVLAPIRENYECSE